jgi:dihydrofolate reductase
MRVSMIAALDRRGLIGDEHGLPWRLSADLRRFRALTWGKPIVMGRKTFAHLGKPLPGRLNIVLTRNRDFDAPGCRVARTLEEALSVAADYLAGTGGDEVMIIGGGTVYAEAMPRWDRCYLTVVEGNFEGDAYFPLRELLRQRWRPACAAEEHAADEKNPHRHSFHVLDRVRDESDQPAPWPEDADLTAILARGTG